MTQLSLTFKIFMGKVKLSWWKFRDDMLDRIFGEFVVHIYKLDERYSAGVVYKGQETIYYSVLAAYGRKKLFHWSRLFAQTHWYDKQQPHLLFKYCPIEELTAAHASRVELFEKLVENVEKLNQITSKLNLAANRFTA